MPTHAIIRTGGKQYIVQPGKTYHFQRLPGEAGSAVTFQDVLCTFGDGGTDVHVGTPTVVGACVTGTVVQQGRTKKVMVVKYRAKSRYRRLHGHRQHYTAVTIGRIATE